MQQQAALYLRSSKDRSSVSIDAQRHELKILATSRSLIVVAEFTDVVESGKTDQRPGFQALLHAFKDNRRGWNVLLVTDTSRLSRRRYVAQVFKHEARRHGIEILYSKVPETDPITAVILEAVFEAMDEVHSLISREKGLAGMAENVRQGYRAGGRAPIGYRLKRLDMGIIRDGETVTKTQLEPDGKSALIARYLQKRAHGEPRTQAARAVGLNLSQSSLIALEWNALTYAGHTTWNRHSADGEARKFRPRAEWMIQRDTHPALITDAEAESILQALSSSTISASVSAAKQGMSNYLLTGLLYTPDGRTWEGWRGQRYRVKPNAEHKGRYVDRDALETAVCKQVLHDLHTPSLIRDLTRAAQIAAAQDEPDPAHELRTEAARLVDQISKAMDLAIELADPAPAIRKANELETRRIALTTEIERLEREHAHRAIFQAMTEERVKTVLEGIATDLNQTPPDRWKTVLRALIARIELNPDTLECQVRYRIAAEASDTLGVASPRGHTGWGIETTRKIRLWIAQG